MKRPIAISLSPDTEKDDVILALKTLLTPRKWLDESEVEELEREFAQKFGESYKALAVNSGRSAQYLILKALGIGRGDRVAIQAFTCVAVPNSILWVGAKPLYIDIDTSYNMSPKDLVEKINEKTKAIIVQHTFGTPADIDEIEKITKRNNAVLIEDCAHSLGAKYDNEHVGMFGEVSFFSFGRDKVLSSVFGGMILCSNEALYKELKKLRDNLKTPPRGWIAQQLFHPVAFSFILPLYKIGIGKILLVLFQKLGLLSKAVYKEEKLTKKYHIFPTRMPGALAILARNQLKKLDRFNKHRQNISQLYNDSLAGTRFKLPPVNSNSIWLRYPVRHNKADNLYNFAKSKGVLLGDWYRDVVTPVEDLSLVGYKKESCPVAEKYAETVINLPTYPAYSKTQARYVVKLINQWLNTR